MDGRTTLCRIVHGSTLFGLATPTSDRDFISVVLPSREDVLMGDVFFTTFNGSTGDDNTPNSAHDIDDKQISLAQFMRLVTSGTLETIELLNAPDEFHDMEPHPLFQELRANRARLASRNVEKIIGFCRSQAVTYSPRKERLEAVHKAIDVVTDLAGGDLKQKVGQWFPRIVEDVASEFVRIVAIPLTGGREMDHLEVCGKMIAATSQAALALEILNGARKKYGRRVSENVETSKSDWKSLSHALRIAREGTEYVTTGSVTLPVPDAPWLLKVKLGQVDLETVSREVHEAVHALDRAAVSSPLPVTPDEDFVREFLMAAHYAAVSEPMTAIARPPACSFQ